jgi:hypothetical protein
MREQAIFIPVLNITFTILLSILYATHSHVCISPLELIPRIFKVFHTNTEANQVDQIETKDRFVCFC